jgi:hypothetical protein
MAIAFTASADLGNTTAASTFSGSYTCGSGSNTLLIIGVVGDHTSDQVTGVTYNSVPMTLINKFQASASPWTWQYLFYLLNPASGSHTAVVSASGVCSNLAMGAADYTGVVGGLDVQTTHASGANVTTLTSSITTAIDNDWAILFEVGFDNNADLMGPTAGAGLILRQATTTFSGVWGLFDSNGVIHPAGAYSMTTNRTSSSTAIGHNIAAFSPTSGAVAWTPVSKIQRNWLVRKGLG